MKPHLNQYLEVIPTYAKGIPCQLAVTHFVDQPADSTCWDSDLDYYGYTEIEMELLDRKGYPALWLEKKLTDEDRYELEQEAINYLRSQYND